MNLEVALCHRSIQMSPDALSGDLLTWECVREYTSFVQALSLGG